MFTWKWVNKNKFILCNPVTLKRVNIFSNSWRHDGEKSPTVKTCPHHILIKQPNSSLKNPGVTYTGSFHLCEDVLQWCQYFQLGWLRMGGAYREEIQTLLSFTGIQACWAPSSDSLTPDLPFLSRKTTLHRLPCPHCSWHLSEVDFDNQEN